MRGRPRRPRAAGQCDGASHRRQGWLGDAELRHCRRGGSTAQPEPHDYVDSGHDGDGRAACTRTTSTRRTRTLATYDDSLTQAPSGMTIDAASGVISWVPPAGAPTPAQVIVVATDNHATIATQSFEITVSPAALGRGLVGGWVLDDTTGLPIQNATAQLLDAAGQPTTTLPVNSDSRGRFRLSAVSGPVRIRVTKEGYTSADLAVTIVDGRRVEPDDARLTPLNPSTAVVSSVAGGFISRGVARLTFDPASLTQDRALTLTDVGLQGLIRRLPLGGRPGSAGCRWWFTAIRWCRFAVSAAGDDARQRS